MHQTKDSMPAAHQFLPVIAALLNIFSLGFKLSAPRRQPVHPAPSKHQCLPFQLRARLLASPSFAHATLLAPGVVHGAAH